MCLSCCCCPWAGAEISLFWGVFLLSLPRILGVTLPQKQGKSWKDKSKEIQKSKERGIGDRGCLRRFLGSAMGIAIANRKNHCDLGALRSSIKMTKVSKTSLFDYCSFCTVPRIDCENLVGERPPDKIQELTMNQSKPWPSNPCCFRFPNFRCFFCFPVSLAFLCVFFLSFPRILGVSRREKPLFFSGFPLFFSKKQGLECRGNYTSQK